MAANAPKPKVDHFIHLCMRSLLKKYENCALKQSQRKNMRESDEKRSERKRRGIQSLHEYFAFLVGLHVFQFQ